MTRSTMPDAARYDRWSRIMGPVYDRIARTVARAAPPNGAVLDVGCGPGQLAIRIARRAPGLRVTGTDIDPAMVARATANAERAFAGDDPARPTFVVGDVAALPFAEGAFDLVVSTFSLHHWADPAAGLVDVHRVLRPDARALIWDLAGPLRHRHAGAPEPVELAAGSPFGSLAIGGRVGLGPLVLAERYDLVRAPD